MSARMTTPRSVIEVLAARVRERPEQTTLLEKRLGRWCPSTIDDLYRTIGELAFGLRKHGVNGGHVGALLIATGASWLVADLALQSLGGRSLAIDPQSPAAEITSALAETGSRIAFVDSWETAETLMSGRDRGDFPALGLLIGVGPLAPETGSYEGWVSYVELCGQGRKLLEAGENFERLIEERDPLEAAVITLSTDADGKRRRTLVDHSRLLAGSRAMVEAFGLTDKDRVFALEKLADPIERSATLYAALLSDALLMLPESASTAMSSLREVSPTYVHVSGQWLSKLGLAIHARLKRARGLKGWVVRWWLRHAKHPDRTHQPPRAGRWLVGNPVLHKLGLDHTRILVVSGATSPNVLRFFTALGLAIQSVNSRADGSVIVGVNTDVRIGSDERAAIDDFDRAWNETAEAGAVHSARPSPEPR